MKRALDLLKECNSDKKRGNLLSKESNLLRIEDLLPYFSDFEKIDDFKEAICDALKVGKQFLINNLITTSIHRIITTKSKNYKENEMKAFRMQTASVMISRY